MFLREGPWVSFLFFGYNFLSSFHENIQEKFVKIPALQERVFLNFRTERLIGRAYVLRIHLVAFTVTNDVHKALMHM